MANARTYTLTLDAQELHDLIEAALVCECQAAQIIGWTRRSSLHKTPVWRGSSGGCRRRKHEKAASDNG